MRRLVLLRYCQIDWSEDRREVPAKLSVTVNGKDLDLCEEHAESIPMAMFEQVLSEYGVPVPKDPGKRPPKPPKDTPQPSKGLHAIKISDTEWQCPEPHCTHGEDGGPYKTDRPSAIGAHRRWKHGYVSPERARREALSS